MDIRPVKTLPDEDVVALIEGMMDEMQSARMSALQYKQQAGTINKAERAELKMLMDSYEAGQLRKTQALVEAVSRGLREPFAP